MRALFTMLLHINHADEEVILRGRNLIKVVSGLLLGLCIAGVLWLSRGNMIASTGVLICGIVFIIAIWLTRRGMVTLGGSMVLGALTFVIALNMVFQRAINDIPFFILLPIVVAGAIFAPRQVLVISAVAYLTLMLTVQYIFSTVPSPVRATERIIVLDATVLFMGFSGISYLISSSVSDFLRRASQTKQEIGVLASSLERMNADLESQVAQRTIELAQALQQQQSQAIQLQNSLEQQQALSETINALSLPLIPVHRDILVLPLIGNIDAQRSQLLLDNTLRQIEQTHARALILDVTGVALVDTQLAHSMLHLAQATRLLGAETVLVGIRPEIAQTLVSLGADLGQLRSAASLQEGLEMMGSR